MNRAERRAYEAQLRHAQKQAMKRGAERAIKDMPTEIFENPIPIALGLPTPAVRGARMMSYRDRPW